MTTRRVRQEAALILALAASNRCGTALASEALGVGHASESVKLASAAFAAALPAWSKWLGPHRKPRPVFAEAEAMLRTGWSPKPAPVPVSRGGS